MLTRGPNACEKETRVAQSMVQNFHFGLQFYLWLGIEQIVGYEIFTKGSCSLSLGCGTSTECPPAADLTK